MVMERIRDPILKKKILWGLGILIFVVVITSIVLTFLYDRTRDIGWIEYSVENSGLVNFAHMIEFDHFGHAWIGTLRGGINIFDGESWRSYSTENSEILCNEIRDIAFNNLGNVWIGTSEGLSVFDGESWVSYTTENSGISGNYIQDIEFDDPGNVWIGTSEGLSVFDGESWVSYTTDNSGISGNTIRDIEFDHLGNTWIGTDNGISIFDGVSWQTFTKENSDFPYGDIREIEFDNLGHVWIRKPWRLYVFDGENWESHGFIDQFANPQDNNKDYLYSLEIDSSGRILVSSRSALRIYDGDIWVTYNSQNSGYGISVHIAIDPQGRIWLSGDGDVIIATVDAAGLPQIIPQVKRTLFELFDWRTLWIPVFVLTLFWICLAIYLENYVILYASAIAGLALLIKIPDTGLGKELVRLWMVSIQIGGILGGIIGSVVRKRRNIVSMLPTSIGFVIGAFIGFGLFYLLAWIIASITYAG